MTKLHQLPQHSFHVEYLRVSTNVRLTRGGWSISVELGREPPVMVLSLLYLALSTLFAVYLGCLLAGLHYRAYPIVRS